MNTYPSKAPSFRRVHTVKAAKALHEVALYRRGVSGQYEVLVGRGWKGQLRFPTSKLQPDERMPNMIRRVGKAAVNQELSGLVSDQWPTEYFDSAVDGKEATALSMVNCNKLSVPLEAVASDKEATDRFRLRQLEWRPVPVLLQQYNLSSTVRWVCQQRLNEDTERTYVAPPSVRPPYLPPYYGRDVLCDCSKPCSAAGSETEHGQHGYQCRKPYKHVKANIANV